VPSEFELIRRYFVRTGHDAPGPGRGASVIGDDCALLAAPAGLALAVTTDLLVEGTHFLPGTDARRLGHKALAVNLSDLAAMGADPRWFLLGLALPEADEPWLAAFAAGMFALADAHRIELVGGDTTRGPRTITITAIGTLPPGYALRRDAAAAGEDLWLSGATGEAALGLAHLRGRVKLDAAAAAQCVLRLEAPEPRVDLGRRLRGIAAAAIDVSDGLLADVGHVAGQSKVGAEIDYDALPRAAALAACPDRSLADECLLGGGDDYELAFTAPPGKREEVERAGRAAGVAVARIGRIVAGPPEARVLAGGKPVAAARRGFDHFR
jgi:thiamine-monophosphate kinase